MNVEPYTVLLQRPGYLTEGDSPFLSTYLWAGRAHGVYAAIEMAQEEAAEFHEVENPEDYAVLFVCYGEREDITPGEYQ